MTSSKRENFWEVLVFAVVVALGIIPALIGTVSLTGWYSGMSDLVGIGGDYLPLPPSTSLLLLLFGSATVLRTVAPTKRWARWGGLILVGLTMLIAFSLAVMLQLNMEPDVEHFGLEITEMAQGAPVGHMSRVAAICFLLAGVSYLVSLPSRATRPWSAIVALGFTGTQLAICSIFLAFYVWGKPSFYGGEVIPPTLSGLIALLPLCLVLIYFCRQTAQLLRKGQHLEVISGFDLSLVFVGLVSGILVAGFFSYRSYERYFIQEAARQLSAFADSRIEDLVRYREERLADTVGLGHNPAFSRLVADSLARPGDAQARQELEEWLDGYLGGNVYDRIDLLDAQGRPQLSLPATAGPMGAAISQRTAEILEKRAAVFLDFYQEGEGQPVYLSLLVPIYEAGNGNRPLGVINLRIDPRNFLFSYIRRWPVPNVSAEMFLIRRLGSIGVILDENLFNRPVLLDLILPRSDFNEPSDWTILEQSDIGEGIDFRGVRVMSVGRRVPASPWTLVARRELSGVYGPLQKQLWQLGALVGVLVLGAGGGMRLMWVRQRAELYEERMRADAAACEREARFSAMIESFDFGAVSADSEGKIMGWNASAEEIFGYSKREILHRDLAILLPSCCQPVPPARSASIPSMAAFQILNKKGGELVGRHKDGRELLLRGSISFWENDGRKYCSVIFSDVTERVQAEERIRKLSTVVQQASLSVAITDLAGNIEYVNPRFCAVSGYSSEEVLGKNPRFMKSGETPAKVYQDLWQTISRGAVWSGKLHNRRKNGENLHEFVTIAPVVDEQGVATHYVALKEDVSPEHFATARLTAELVHERHVSELKTRFIAVTSHEFRTPMAAALGSIEILANHHDRIGPAKRAELLTRISTALHRMSVMLDQILLLNRMDSDRLGTRLAPVDFGELVNRIVEEARLGDSSPHRFELHLFGDASNFETDVAQMQHIIENLLSNAVRYSPAGSTITLRMEADADQILLMVADSGIGIPAADQSRIFEPFERGSNVGQINGTGIGLNIVKRLVEGLGGAVRIESAEGQGTKFFLVFPRKNSPTAPP